MYSKSKWMEVLLMMMALYDCNQIKAMGNLADVYWLFFPIVTKEEQMGNLFC